jgi:hypothetical protein
MDSEFPIEWVSQKDDVTPKRDGTMERTRVYTFYLGKFGPFTEKIPRENEQETELRDRVERLRAALRTSHTL